MESPQINPVFERQWREFAMPRTELKQGESTAEMKIFIKHLVITFPGKF